MLKREKSNIGGRSDWKEREEYLRRNGYSQQEIIKLRKRRKIRI